MPPHATPDLALAVGVSDETIRRWAKWGLIPPPERANLGSRGNVSRWTDEALQQALWVKGQLDAGRSKGEILAALRAGEYAPRSSGS